MSTIQSIRFQKLDKFDNPIFICSGSKKEESENFNELKRIAQKLAEFECYAPVYYSEAFNYCTLRLKKDYKSPTFIENASYDINYKIRIKNQLDNQVKTTVICYADLYKKVSDPPKIDIGEELII